MIKFLTTGIITIAMLVASYCNIGVAFAKQNFVDKSSNNIETSQALATASSNEITAPEYDPVKSINYGAVETGWHRAPIIGRHSMIQIKNCAPLGRQFIQQLSIFYDGNSFKNFKVEETCTTIKSTTLSTIRKESTSISTILQSQANIPGFNANLGTEVKSVYTIENSSTYTITNAFERKLSFDIRNEKIEDRVFALGMIADVYKITYQTWDWDDYWWGHYEVSGSRSTYTGYITCDPQLALIFKGE